MKRWKCRQTIDFLCRVRTGHECKLLWLSYNYDAFLFSECIKKESRLDLIIPFGIGFYRGIDFTGQTGWPILLDRKFFFGFREREGCRFEINWAFKAAPKFRLWLNKTDQKMPLQKIIAR